MQSKHNNKGSHQITKEENQRDREEKDIQKQISSRWQSIRTWANSLPTPPPKSQLMKNHHHQKTKKKQKNKDKNKNKTKQKTTLESIKKILHAQRQTSHNEMVGGRNHNKIKPHTLWVGNAHAGQQSHHRSSPPGVSPKHRAGVPSWRSDNGRRGPQRTRLWWQVGLTAGIPRKRGRQRLYSWRARTRTCAKQGLVSLVLQGLLWGWGRPVSEAHHGDRGTSSTNSGRCLPAWLPR